MGMFDWLMGSSAAPVNDTMWESRAKKMAQNQQLIDQLRQESKQQRASEMIGGGGGGGRWQARPQILVPGNTLGSALAQGAMGFMAGQQQRGQDAAMTEYEKAVQADWERKLQERFGGGQVQVPGHMAPAPQPIGPGQMVPAPTMAPPGATPGFNPNAATTYGDLFQGMKIAGEELSPTMGGTQAPRQSGTSLPLSVGATPGVSEALAEEQARKDMELEIAAMENARAANSVLPGSGVMSFGEDEEPTAPIGGSPMPAASLTAAPEVPISATPAAAPAPAAPKQSDFNRDMLWAGQASVNPLGKAMAQKMWAERLGGEFGASSSGGKDYAPIAIHKFRMSLSPEERKDFDEGRWSPKTENFGSFRRDPVTGRIIATTMTPDQMRRSKDAIIAMHNSQNAIDGYIAAAGGDMARANQMMQEAISQDIADLEGSQQTPQSVLPQATGGVQGVDATAEELRIIGQLKRQGMSDKQIAAQLQQQFGGRPPALPQATGRVAPPIADPAAVAQRKAYATQTGQNTADQEQAFADRQKSISRFDAIAQDAMKILTGPNQPTESYIGKGLDIAGQVVGVSTPGAAEANNLKSKAAMLMNELPKPKGDANMKEYQNVVNAIGDLGNETLPIETRISGLQSAYKAYVGKDLNLGGSGKEIKRVGTRKSDGRRVIEYTDGTREVE